MNISDALKRFREYYGLNQKEMASRLHMLPQAYGRYETGKHIPSAELIVKIADTFNVSTDYLLGRSDVPNNEVSKEIFQAAAKFNQAFNAAINSSPKN